MHHKGNSQRAYGGLGPPRFSLRYLLVLVSAIAVFIVLCQTYDPLKILAATLMLAAVGLHVVGNAIGTRLRSSSTGLKDGRQQRLPASEPAPRPDDYAPPTKLSHKTSLGWPLLIATCVGIAVGGSAGFTAMHHIYGDRLEVEAIVVGVIATMALGGLWFFWCWSLVHVLISAWWHAHSSSPRKDKRQP